MADDTPMLAALRRRIASLRKARGLTQEELGDRVGVSKTTVMEWEGGGRANSTRRRIAPSPEHMEALETALGVRWWLVDVPRSAPDPGDLDEAQRALVGTLATLLRDLKGEAATRATAAIVGVVQDAKQAGAAPPDLGRGAQNGSGNPSGRKQIGRQGR